MKHFIAVSRFTRGQCNEVWYFGHKSMLRIRVISVLDAIYDVSEQGFGPKMWQL